MHHTCASKVVFSCVVKTPRTVGINVLYKKSKSFFMSVRDNNGLLMEHSISRRTAKARIDSTRIVFAYSAAIGC